MSLVTETGSDHSTPRDMLSYEKEWSARTSEWLPLQSSIGTRRLESVVDRRPFSRRYSTVMCIAYHILEVARMREPGRRHRTVDAKPMLIRREPMAKVKRTTKLKMGAAPDCLNEWGVLVVHRSNASLDGEEIYFGNGAKACTSGT